MMTCTGLLRFLLVVPFFFADPGLTNMGTEGLKAGSRGEAEELTLRLVFFDAVGLEAGIERILRAEVDAIFRQARIRIHWLEPEDVASGYDGYFLRAILLPRPPTMFRQSADTMGMVLSRRSPADTVFLFDPVLRRVLRGRASRIPPSLEERGRVYGKVLAHEVIHALAPDQPHARSGLMAASLQPNVLTARRIRLDEASASALRRGLSCCACSGSGPPGP